MEIDFNALHQSSSVEMFIAGVALWFAHYHTNHTDVAIKAVALAIYESFLSSKSTLRNFFMGSFEPFATLNMNNCGVEERNGNLKAIVGVEQDVGPFMEKSFGWVENEGLRRIDNPNNPNVLHFETFVKIKSSM